MTRVAILISGGGSNMVALVESMAAAGHPATPCLVLSNVPEAGGLHRAQALGVPTAVVDHRRFGRDRTAFETVLATRLAEARADHVCLAGFLRILTPAFVAEWERRMLNIHPSLLPRHKGLDTHARVLAAGDTHHGCTVHEVTAALDDGPILGQAKLLVEPVDTEASLARRVLALEHRLYPIVLRRHVMGEHARFDLT